MSALRRGVNAVLSTLSFFTAIPVLAGRRGNMESVNYALLPLVGLVLGAGLLAIDQAAGLVLPTAATSAAVIVALVALTGAIHLDGLADSADGLFGGRDREARLAIMDDPRNGAFGFVAIACVLLLKFGALLELEGWLRSGVLLLFPCLGRHSALLVLASFSPARAGGLGAGAAAVAGRLSVAVGTLMTLAAALIVFGPQSLALVAAAAAVGVLGAACARARIGGITGDVLGAIVELSEATVLLVAASSASGGWLA